MTKKLMRNEHPHLQIQVYEISGSTQRFAQTDTDLAKHSLLELHPALLFTQDRITIANGDSESSFVPPLVTRIDLLTDRLSVWDFPFVLGALFELSEAEFSEGVHALQGPSKFDDGTQVFLDLEMLGSQHTYLWMQIIAGLPATCLNKVYCLLNERRLIFGLRTGGVGILNLANLLHLSVHPEPLQSAMAARRVHPRLAPSRPEQPEPKIRRQLKADNLHDPNLMGIKRSPLDD